MKPVKFQVVGEEDYAFGIDIRSDGSYQVTSGTYASEPPRSGKLDEMQQRELLAAIEALGIPEAHPMPQGATAFEAHLTVGEGEEAIEYPFWEGALESDEKLKRLVRLLESY
ncbi:MAG: hypothetical protein Kow006_20810 [Gammaproteobacteria bacterium]